MELQAVLGVFLSLSHACKREREEREREGEKSKRGRGEPARAEKKRKKRNMSWCKPDLPSSFKAVLPCKRKEGRNIDPSRPQEQKGGRRRRKRRGEKLNPKPDRRKHRNQTAKKPDIKRIFPDNFGSEPPKHKAKTSAKQHQQTHDQHRHPREFSKHFRERPAKT